MTITRSVGHALRVAALVQLGVVASCSSVVGQVGHPPGSSPYRDIPRAAGPVISVNYWEGAPGRADVGITNSLMAGVFYDIAVMGTFRVLAGVSYGRGERYVQDPPADAANRRSGPYEDSFLLPEAEVQLLITGHKSWHRIVPYLTIAGGFMLGGAEPVADTSDYQLGNKFVYSPGVGFRFYPGSGRFRAMVDARMLFLKLSYPAEFFVEGDDGTAVLESTEDSEQWTHTQRVRIGIGWTF
jgi:hypothetical protein